VLDEHPGRQPGDGVPGDVEHDEQDRQSADLRRPPWRGSSDAPSQGSGQQQVQISEFVTEVAGAQSLVVGALEERSAGDRLEYRQV
jgi:hypothetical protein